MKKKKAFFISIRIHTWQSFLSELSAVIMPKDTHANKRPDTEGQARSPALPSVLSSTNTLSYDSPRFFFFNLPVLSLPLFIYILPIKSQNLSSSSSDS